MLKGTITLGRPSVTDLEAGLVAWVEAVQMWPRELQEGQGGSQGDSDRLTRRDVLVCFGQRRPSQTQYVFELQPTGLLSSPGLLSDQEAGSSENRPY